VKTHIPVIRPTSLMTAQDARGGRRKGMEVAKISHLAGEDYSYCSKPGWDNTNLSMFCRDLKTSRMIVENTFNRAEELEVQQVAITE
jgi:hypothetical protein